MKFLDPWASFQYMGGVFLIHVVMAVYCVRHLFWMNEILEKEIEDPGKCTSECQQFNPDDVLYMLLAHIFGMVTTIWFMV